MRTVPANPRIAPYRQPLQKASKKREEPDNNKIEKMLKKKRKESKSKKSEPAQRKISIDAKINQSKIITCTDSLCIIKYFQYSAAIKRKILLTLTLLVQISTCALL